MMQNFVNSISTLEVVPAQCVLEFIFTVAIHDHKSPQKGNNDVVHQHHCQTFEITRLLSIKAHPVNTIIQCQLNTIYTSHI